MSHASKRHLVSKLQLQSRSAPESLCPAGLTIVSPCGARREGAPRKLLGALVDGEPLSLASSSRASAALRSPLRLKLAIDKVQSGGKAPASCLER